MKKHPFRAAFALFLMIVMFSGCQFVSDCASKKLESKCSELINYFNEIALYSESGKTGGGNITRWETPIRLKALGDYTDEDFAALKNLVGLLNKIDGMPQITIVENQQNYFFYFIPIKKMSIIPLYIEGNWCSSAVYWDEDFKIYKAYTGIANDVTKQEDRNYMVLQQLIGCLGFMNDADKYPDSVFYNQWTGIQSMSDMDHEIISMLYSPSIHAGMDGKQVEEALMPYVKAKYLKEGYFD